MTQRKLSIALFTILAFFLCGCGQKGTLYLPRSPEPVQPAELPESEDEEESQEQQP